MYLFIFKLVHTVHSNNGDNELKTIKVIATINNTNTFIKNSTTAGNKKNVVNNSYTAPVSHHDSMTPLQFRSFRQLVFNLANCLNDKKIKHKGKNTRLQLKNPKKTYSKKAAINFFRPLGHWTYIYKLKHKRD